MLQIVLVTVSLCTLGACATAIVARRVMNRFGLDAMTTMLWLGLAERAAAPRPRRRVVSEPSQGFGRPDCSHSP